MEIDEIEYVWQGQSEDTLESARPVSGMKSREDRIMLTMRAPKLDPFLGLEAVSDLVNFSS